MSSSPEDVVIRRPPNGRARGRDGVRVEFDVEARMRDGAILRANVYRPDGPGAWPTLLARTPYGKDLPPAAGWLDPVQTAARGFMVVIQDTRGRFASDGEWDPFRFEREDGFDSVEWAARLAGSNGRVGMYGASYWGNSQWMAAAERPPSLAAITPSITWSDPMDGLFARGGAVELGLAVPWTLQQGFAHLQRVGADGARDAAVGRMVDDWDRLREDGYWELPVSGMPVLCRHAVPDLGSIRALEDAGIAERCRVDGAYDDLDVPAFQLGGWHDIFLQGTLDNHRAMVERGVESRLLVGPWTHMDFSDPVGELCFGLRASKDGVPAHPHGDVTGFQLEWLRSHLDPEADVRLPDSPVRLFVMGRDEWRDEERWPLARAVDQRWYLQAGGGLSPAAPSDAAAATTFVYDPRDPVPTVGGHTVMWPGYPAGPFDQRRIEQRDDVLTFTSDALDGDLEVTGRISVVLHAASSAPSTDWVARLCDVHPDGRSINLCDGIVRVERDASAAREVRIDLWSTSNVFLRGHRLRVHVTSSSFPRWDRNLNTGDQRSPASAPAEQRVLHGRSTPSFIELPVVA
jgi:putative CocE/NonD family hydrolase